MLLFFVYALLLGVFSFQNVWSLAAPTELQNSFEVSLKEIVEDPNLELDRLAHRLSQIPQGVDFERGDSGTKMVNEQLQIAWRVTQPLLKSGKKDALVISKDIWQTLVPLFTKRAEALEAEKAYILNEFDRNLEQSHLTFMYQEKQRFDAAFQDCDDAQRKKLEEEMKAIHGIFQGQKNLKEKMDQLRTLAQKDDSVIGYQAFFYFAFVDAVSYIRNMTTKNDQWSEKFMEKIESFGWDRDDLMFYLLNEKGPLSRPPHRPVVTNTDPQNLDNTLPPQTEGDAHLADPRQIPPLSGVAPTLTSA